MGFGGVKIVLVHDDMMEESGLVCQPGVALPLKTPVHDRPPGRWTHDGGDSLPS